MEKNINKKPKPTSKKNGMNKPLNLFILISLLTSCNLESVFEKDVKEVESDSESTISEEYSGSLDHNLITTDYNNILSVISESLGSISSEIENYDDIRALYFNYEVLDLPRSETRFDCPVKGSITRILSGYSEWISSNNCQTSQGGFSFDMSTLNTETRYDISSIRKFSSETLTYELKNISYDNKVNSDRSSEISLISTAGNITKIHNDEGEYYESDLGFFWTKYLGVKLVNGSYCSFFFETLYTLGDQSTVIEESDISDYCLNDTVFSELIGWTGYGNTLVYQLEVEEDDTEFLGVFITQDLKTDLSIRILDINGIEVNASSFDHYYRRQSTVLNKGIYTIEIRHETFEETLPSVHMQIQASNIEIKYIEEIEAESLLDEINGQWLSSGGKDINAMGNFKYEMIVAEYAKYYLQLTSSKQETIGLYLSLMDSDGNEIEQHSSLPWVFFGGDLSKKIEVYLEPGTYYVGVGTFESGDSADFRLTLKSNKNNATIFNWD